VRIFENVKGETHNVVQQVPVVGPAVNSAGETLDKWRIELDANAYGPLLEQWFIQSRNTAINGAMPIPANIRAQLVGFYDDDILNRGSLQGRRRLEPSILPVRRFKWMAMSLP